MTIQAVGRYRVLELLGTGGMGQVHRCVDESSKQLLAIKFLRTDRDEAPELVRRFEREIDTLRQLAHPHIVHLHDEGTFDGKRFYVMTLLSQGSLSDLLERHERLPLPFALRTARQLASALGFAHQNRHVHRDIKPSNIRFDVMGNALLIDFGLAKPLDAQPENLTADGTMLGTLCYMAPEQVRGEEASAASDIYQLGVVLYEMITGKLPHAGGDVLRSLAEGPGLRAAPPSAHVPEVPPDVDAAVARMLAPDKAERPRTAEDVAALLAACGATMQGSGVFSATRPTKSMPDVEAAPDADWRERAKESATRTVATVKGSQPVRTALKSCLAASLVILLGMRFELPRTAAPAMVSCELTSTVETTDLVVVAAEPCFAFVELATARQHPAILYNRRAGCKIAFRGLPVLPGRVYQTRVWLSRQMVFPDDGSPPCAFRTFRAPAGPLPAPSLALPLVPPGHGDAAALASTAGVQEAVRLLEQVRPRRAFSPPETPTTRENFSERLQLLESAEKGARAGIATGEVQFPKDELDQLQRLFQTDSTQACSRLDTDLAFLASATN